MCGRTSYTTFHPRVNLSLPRLDEINSRPMESKCSKPFLPRRFFWEQSVSWQCREPELLRQACPSQQRSLFVAIAVLKMRGRTTNELDFSMQWKHQCDRFERVWSKERLLYQPRWMWWIMFGRGIARNYPRTTFGRLRKPATPTPKPFLRFSCSIPKLGLGTAMHGIDRKHRNAAGGHQTELAFGLFNPERGQPPRTAHLGSQSTQRGGCTYSWLTSSRLGTEKRIVAPRTCCGRQGILIHSPPMTVVLQVMVKVILFSLMGSWLVSDEKLMMEVAWCGVLDQYGHGVREQCVVEYENMKLKWEVTKQKVGKAQTVSLRMGGYKEVRSWREKKQKAKTKSMHTFHISLAMMTIVTRQENVALSPNKPPPKFSAREDMAAGCALKAAPPRTHIFVRNMWLHRLATSSVNIPFFTSSLTCAAHFHILSIHVIFFDFVQLPCCSTYVDRVQY